MPTDLPRYEGNERVDLTDFGYTVDDALQAMIRQLNEEFLTDPGGSTKSWILDGFAMADLGFGQLQITKGRALLAQREGAEIHYGALTTEGDTTKTLDLSGYANDTYNIYLRFQYVDAETQSRLFWNPSGSGSEFAQSIQTRRQANWSMRVELASPGSEWTQIGTVEIAAGVIGGAGIVDQRNFYFEGSVSGSYASGWGSANDRTATRSGQYGIKDLQQFTAAVRQLFEDLRPSGGRWWEARGLKAIGKAGSGEAGIDGTGDGTGAGVYGIGEAGQDAIGVHGQGKGTEPGVYGVAENSTNSDGVHGQGKGNGFGVRGDGTAGTNSVGVYGQGGGTSSGVYGIAEVGQIANGVEGRGKETGIGVLGTGEAGKNAIGVRGQGGGTSFGVYGIGQVGQNAGGVEGKGQGTGEGIKGTGGATSGTGIIVQGGSPDGHGIEATGDGTGEGVIGTGGDTSGQGVKAIGGAPNGHALFGAGTGAGSGVYATGGAIGHGGDFWAGGGDNKGIGSIGTGTGEGVTGDGGTTSGTGGRFTGGAPNGIGVQAVGIGTGASLDFNFYLEGTEMADPAAPAANKGRIYFRDNGGKTELVAVFPTGAVQQIAIEP